jgi:hypothetical protein
MLLMVPVSPLTVSSDGYTLAGTQVPKPVPLGPAGIETLCVTVQVYGLLPVHCALARAANPMTASVAHRVRTSRINFSRGNPGGIVERSADDIVETSHSGQSRILESRQRRSAQTIDFSRRVGVGDSELARRGSAI